MRLPLLACVASVAAYSAKLQTHMYQTTDLWRDSDVPSLRPVSTAQSPAATKLSLLDEAPDNEDPNNTTYCIAHGGQTMVDDKWCFMSCNNVPPNCPKDLCDCVKGVEAKKKVEAKRPYDASEYYLGRSKKTGGALQSPALARWVADRAQRGSAIMKEQRKAAEERSLARSGK